MAGMTTAEIGGSGWLRTKPIALSGVALKLRLAGETGAEVKVRVVAASGQLLASGIAKSTMAESSSGTSEEIMVVWSGKSNEVIPSSCA